MRMTNQQPPYVMKGFELYVVQPFQSSHTSGECRLSEGPLVCLQTVVIASMFPQVPQQHRAN